MKLKSLAACSPVVLLLVAGAARAELEPFSFGATETISHDDNLNHTADGRTASWISDTALNAALSEPLGRDLLSANAAINYSTYSNASDRNSLGYRAGARFDWSTVGDLSGTLGVDSRRQQYVYGVEGGDAISTRSSNLQTTNHADARIELGAMGRWRIYAGGNVSQVEYSAETFASNEERQWSGNVGTSYSSSPDLSFGIVGNYVHGEYPHYVDILGNPTSAGFSSKALSLTTRWQASGNSALDATLGYTTQTSDLQPTQDFVSGSLNWTWTPPSHFSVRLGLARSSDGGATSGTLYSLNNRSLNTTASLGVTYALTGKISLTGKADYIQRKYDNVQVPFVQPDGSSQLSTLNGTNHTQRFGLYANYMPTRTTTLRCGASHENLSANSSIMGTTPNYTDTIYMCSGSISFS